jgi:multisubunit Na+/H+ antiporter MnhC subunit
VTGTAVAAPPSEDDQAPVAPATERTPPREIAWLRRPFVAALVLLLVYVAASFALNDPRGTLGTDTGGKLATLHMMERNGGLNPDVGYWAQRYDPHGVLQPLHYTYRVGDKWVNVTTLPMLVVAYPLYLGGGNRAVLLLPMLGAVACALAGAALTRRLVGGDGMRAFWVIGCATPVAIYALDFWEHSIGLALTLWAVVLVWDVMERRAGWRGAFGAGVLFGVAATMRTESLVYFLVTVGLAGLAMLWRDRSLLRPITTGVAALVGLLAMLVGNRLLEQVLIGTDLRGARVASTAAGSGSGFTERVREALTTAVGLGFASLSSGEAWLLGGIVVILIASGAWLLASRERARVLVGWALIGVALLVYVGRFGDGLGFVPGLLTASPFAAVGLLLAWRSRTLRWPVLLAVCALPIAWATQFTGGADPQWGGRYLLLSGVLLAVAGLAVLREHTRAVAAVLALSVLVTLGGLTWLSVRSHTVADGMETILARHDDMLISRQTHLLREGGAFYDSERRWLTATTRGQLDRAVRIAEGTGTPEFAIIDGPDRTTPRHLGDYRRGATQLVSFIRPDVKVAVTTYRRT